MAMTETLNNFNKLYETTYPDILKYVICHVLKIEDVEDIMQNIYLEVIKKLKKKKEIDKYYILGIAKHKVKDFYRFKYKEKIIFLKDQEEIELLENIPSDFNLEKTVSDKYEVEEVWNILKQKKMIIFRVFYLYYYFDLTIKEISNTLNISESNTKHYLYRTLKELNHHHESVGDKNA